MNNILDLPYDIITYILEYLTVKDIVEFSVCNKKTYDISKSIENKYKITLNISKLDILDSIHKFPNIEFDVNIINDKHITSDFDVLKNLKHINNISYLKIFVNNDLYKITIPKNLKKLELFFFEEYDNNDESEEEDILKGILEQCSDGILVNLRLYYKLFIDLESTVYFKEKLYNLQELFLNVNKIESYKFLKYLKLLRNLSIETRENIYEDIIPEINENLIYLKLFNYISDDINSISEKLKNLKILDLVYSTISNLSGIYLLSNLEELSIKYDNNLVDINPISYLKNLKTLNLSSCENVTDIYYIRYMTNIEHIVLSGTSVSNLEPLKDLKKLKSIDIFDCSNVIDISYISEIEEIDLGFCGNITDFSSLGERVKELDVSNTFISDLSRLTNVTSLDISYNDNITDASMLSKVEILDITQCINLRDISNFVNIKEISASNILYDNIYPFTIAKKILLSSVNVDLVNFSFKIFKNCEDLEIFFLNELSELIVDKSFNRLIIKGYINNLILEEDIKSLSVRNVNNIVNIDRSNLVI